MGWVDREERGEIHGNERGREGREGERGERGEREERHMDRESEEMTNKLAGSAPTQRDREMVHAMEIETRNGKG